MVKTVFRISFFLFKIQLLFYVNPRVTVMKVLLFVFAGAMLDLSTPLVEAVMVSLGNLNIFSFFSYCVFIVAKLLTIINVEEVYRQK